MLLPPVPGQSEAHAISSRRGAVRHAPQVLREAEVERPVECDPDLLLEPRQLAQVDRAPEPPRDEAREPDPEDVRHPRPPADGGELSQRREAERGRRSAQDGGGDVAPDGAALTEGVL